MGVCRLDGFGPFRDPDGSSDGEREAFRVADESTGAVRAP